MKYLLPRSLYKSYGIFDAFENCEGIRVHKNRYSFNLNDDLHRWFVEQNIPYDLEIVEIDEREHSGGENGTLRIIKHRIGRELYIDIDPESLVLFKLTWI